MPDLHVPAIDLERLEQLRSRAASRLSGGAPIRGSMPQAADALAVLHALASSPSTAPDALALLHELQVHQVEIDLQAQELRESRAELEGSLRRQIERYDHQPAGCFTVDDRARLLELNPSGAALLGVARDDAYGLPLDAFFDADGARRFRAALAGLDAGTPRATCRLALCPRNGPERPVLACIGADTAARQFLVNLVDLADG